jgi:hypothetical protein
MASAADLPPPVKPSTPWLIACGTCAVILGLIAAVAVVSAVEACNLLFVKVPANFDALSPQEKAAFIDALPLAALLVVLLAYVLGPFAGSFVAARVAARAPLVHGGLVGLVFLAATIANLIAVPHPLWFNVAAPPALLAAAWLGARAGAARPATSP